MKKIFWVFLGIIVGLVFSWGHYQVDAKSKKDYKKIYEKCKKEKKKLGNLYESCYNEFIQLQRVVNKVNPWDEMK